MAESKYTKKIIAEYFTPESLETHLGSATVDEMLDWFFDQIDLGKADPDLAYLPYELTNTTTIEMLCVDQEQADSHAQLLSKVGQKIGFPVSTTVVDYTT